MAAGVDFLGDAEVKFNQKKEDKSTLTKIFSSILAFIDFFKPFKREVRSI
jgi:hypothetical protein